MLVTQGIISGDQLAEVLARQERAPGTRIGRLLVDLAYVTERQLAELVADQLRIPSVDPAAIQVDEQARQLLPRELAVKHVCLPWRVAGRTLHIVMADPTNLMALDAVSFAVGRRVETSVAVESELLQAIERCYDTTADESRLAHFERLSLAEQLSIVDASDEVEPPESDSELTAEAQGGPVIKLVNGILVDAIRAEASDIHVEPQERGVILRYRIDGLLRKILTMPKRAQSRIASRIKVTAHMDIAERRRPQDGRSKLVLEGSVYDLRVSTLPTADGEKIVIRILPQNRARMTLEELGFEPGILETFKALLGRPQGMLLVTGPTGSGKTSTLYAALNLLRGEETNIVTIEDPVEYRLTGVNQVAVSPRAGLTFATGLRSILRQDPDVVMVGEIRDGETAEVAFQAAQTGHLVLATLHTNDAPSSVTRLVEMGVPPYVVAGSVIGVQAQRLVRRLCACQAQGDGSAPGGGCESCRHTGYRGRLGVHELLLITPNIRRLLLAGAGEDVIRQAAREAGMRPMFEDGLLKVERRLTTRQEVARVAPPAEDDNQVLPLAV